MSDNRFSAPAIRNGDTYCAPWCGFDCSWAAFQQATEEAAALAARLGDGWEPRVWENCGWHYEVRQGKFVISVTTDPERGGHLMGGWRVNGYIAWINTQPQFISEACPNPEMAFTKALHLLEEALASLDRHASLARIVKLEMMGMGG